MFGNHWSLTPPYDNTKVTVELRRLVEQGVKVWDFEYPSYYKGEAKAAFEQKVLDHFWFRQIGQETTGRFLHMFRSRIREIMPYYIQRYESEALLKNAGDPLESYNLTEEYKEDTSGTSKLQTGSEGLAETTTNNERRFSNTPKGGISDLDRYLTEATKDGGKVTTQTEDDTSSTGETSGEKSYKLTRRGNIGVQPLGQEINVYRSALINVDMEIIAELEDLFLMIY